MIRVKYITLSISDDFDPELYYSVRSPYKVEVSLTDGRFQDGVNYFIKWFLTFQSYELNYEDLTTIIFAKYSKSPNGFVGSLNDFSFLRNGDRGEKLVGFRMAHLQAVELPEEISIEMFLGIVNDIYECMEKASEFIRSIENHSILYKYATRIDFQAAH